MAVSKAKLRTWQQENEKAVASVERRAKQYGMREEDILYVYNMPKDTLEGLKHMTDKEVDRKISDLHRINTVKLQRLDPSEGYFEGNLMPSDTLHDIRTKINERNLQRSKLAEVDRIAGLKQVKVKDESGSFYSVDLGVNEKYKDDDFHQTQYKIGNKIYGKVYGNKSTRVVRIQELDVNKVGKGNLQFGVWSPYHFNRERLSQLKKNVLKGIETRLGPAMKQEIANIFKQKRLTNMEIYYLVKYSDAFDFDFIYSEEDAENKLEFMKSTIDKMRNEKKEQIKQMTDIIKPFLE